MANFEFIYTFNGEQEQIIAQYLFEKDAIRDESTLKKFAVSKLNKEGKNTVIKISCCVYFDKKKGEKMPKIPSWYDKCNGKLWFDENRIED